MPGPFVVHKLDEQGKKVGRELTEATLKGPLGIAVLNHITDEQRKGESSGTVEIDGHKFGWQNGNEEPEADDHETYKA